MLRVYDFFVKMMNKYFLFLFFSFSTMLFSKQIDLDIKAKSALLINMDNGCILYEKNKDSLVYPASITKIASVLYVLEHEKDVFNKKCIASQEALKVFSPKVRYENIYREKPYILQSDGTTLWLLKGEVLPLSSLLYGMMIVSANDAANVVAENVGGSIPLFIEKMNVYLKSIGCQNTCFYNPHGLHYPKHVTTAYDIAKITQRALKIPFFVEMVSSLSFVLPKSNMQKEKEYKQYNRLLIKDSSCYYPLAFGVKTGVTDVAGYNLVASAKKEGRTLIAVLLGYEENLDRYNDAKHLFEKAFLEEKKQEKIVEKDKIFSFRIQGSKTPLYAFIKEDLIYEYFPSEREKVRAFVQWDKLTLPIQKGQKVGKVYLINPREKKIEEKEIFAKNQVQKTFLFSFKQFFQRFNKV